MPIALRGLDASFQLACNELPGAFSSGVTTEQSDTLAIVASHCETTRIADGLTTERTIVNWSGLVAAVALCLGAWLAGATIVGRIGRRMGGIGVALASVLIVGALALFFV